MKPAAAPSRRKGMILLNVLIIVAISAAAVTVMLVAQDIGVRRTIRLHDAAQAQAYSRAGELSAVVARVRDAVTAPETDSISEPWAAIGQRLRSRSRTHGSPCRSPTNRRASTSMRSRAGTLPPPWPCSPSVTRPAWTAQQSATSSPRSVCSARCGTMVLCARRASFRPR